MKKRILSLFFAIVLFSSLVSCANTASSFNKENASDSLFYDADGIGDSIYWDAENSAPTYGGASSSKPGTDINTSAGNDLDSRKIIKTATVSFQTKEFDDFISSLNAAIESVGGYVQNSELYGGGISTTRYSRSAYLSVRVPANMYNGFMQNVSSLGAVTHSNEYIDDVTLRYVDTESRIEALETEYNSLMELLAKAESVDYIIMLRERISDIQYQLESYKSQIRKYDDLISYCTVNINVEEVRVEKVSEDKLTFGERISKGLDETFVDIGEGIQDFAVGFVTNLPYIVIWIAVIGIIAVVCTAVVKKSKKKKRLNITESENNEK